MRWESFALTHLETEAVNHVLAWKSRLPANSIHGSPDEGGSTTAAKASKLNVLKALKEMRMYPSCPCANHCIGPEVGDDAFPHVASLGSRNIF